MIDIKILNTNNNTINITNGDFESDEGLSTAIYLSLFTDARAPDDIVANKELQRGWIGNIVSPIEGRELGSLLWLVDQSKLTQKNLNDAIGYAESALEWIVEDGFAISIEITGNIIPRKGFELIIDIFLDDKVKQYYIDLWE